MTRPCKRLIWGEGRNLDNRCSVRIPRLWGQHNLQCNLYCNINQGCLKLHVIPPVQSLQFMWYGGGWGLVVQQMLVKKWGDKWHRLHGTSLQREVTDKGSFLIEAIPQQQIGWKIWGRYFSYRRKYIDALEQPRVLPASWENGKNLNQNGGRVGWVKSVLHARWRRICFAFEHLAMWSVCHTQKGNTGVFGFAGLFPNVQHVTLQVLLGDAHWILWRWLFTSVSMGRKQGKICRWRKPGLNSLWEELQPGLVRRLVYYVVMRFHRHKSGL